MNLTQLRERHEAFKATFDATVANEFPGCDEWHWLRADAAVAGHPGRRNDNQSRDAALAASVTIRAAWDAYIKALHDFYRARDGEHGVLGFYSIVDNSQ